MDSKIIIVDDEVKIVKLIEVLIDWDTLPLKLVGTANDGISALNLIKTEKPDIVILDMKMPGFNGIELICRAKELYPGIHFIIISGYRRFEYAQNAIKYGVEDYLLKPVKGDEINNTLKKVIHKIDNMLIDEFQREHYIEFENRQLEEKFFIDYLGSTGEMNLSLSDIMDEYNIDLKSEIYEIVLIKNDLNGTEINDNEIILLKEKTEGIVRDILSAENINYYYHQNDSGLYILLNYNIEFKEDVRECLVGIIEKLHSIRDLFNNLNSTIARSGGFSDTKELQHSINNVGILIKDRIVSGSGKIYLNQDSDSAQALLKDIFTQTTKNEIIKYTEILDANSIKKVLDDIQIDLLSFKGITGQIIMDIVDEVLDAFSFSLKNRGGNNRVLNEEILSFRSILYSQSKLSAIFSLMIAKLSDIINEEKRLKKDKEALPILEVKKYINENFFMNLSLDNVSSYIGMNPTYFSTLFKKETGVGFLEYLTNVRMDEAKELLGDPKRLISDTASEVGYKDTKHFTKQFKKIVGLSPIEYRKIYY